MKQAIQKLKESIAMQSQDLKDWAASTFDEKLISALPTVLNKKHFKKLSHEASFVKLD